jgi:hypothetical protein
MRTTPNYDGRRFRPVATSANGEAGADTVFHYRQTGDVVWATYAGGQVTHGTLVASTDSDGSLDMRYAHVASDGTLRTGICHSTLEVLADGRYRLHERWRWTEPAAGGEGQSVIEEF